MPQRFLDACVSVAFAERRMLIVDASIHHAYHDALAAVARAQPVFLQLLQVAAVDVGGFCLFSRDIIVDRLPSVSTYVCDFFYIFQFHQPFCRHLQDDGASYHIPYLDVL